MKFHLYRITINSKHIYRFLNNTKEIKIRDITFNQNGNDSLASFTINSSDYNTVTEIAKDNNIKIINVHEFGLYKKITHSFFVKLAATFAIFFILFIVISTQFIWKITINGNYSYTQKEILDYVSCLNVTEGVLKNKVNCENIEKNIRENYNDISWVCAEIKGTNLIIHIKENYITEIAKKESRPYNIVSKYSGKIQSIVVRKGTPLVKKNQYVHKNQILIKGVTDVADESGQKLYSVITGSDGDILGKIKFNYNDQIPVKHKYKIYNSSKTYYIPFIKNYRWHIKSKKNKDIEYSESKIKFFENYYFPIGFGKYVSKDYTIKTANYSKKQAEKVLSSKLNNKLAILEQKGYKILAKNVRIVRKKEFYQYKGDVICILPVGKVQYIKDSTLNKIKQEKESVEQTTADR